ncbi:MAG: NAD-dependent epimerase/dehydratase family protein [Acidibacillus sp.]|nr:NAD-dependent epimerase/dehydratase family protein [Acidibacillus sp.]
MRVLVTGGNGFIGSHLVDALWDAGHEVGVIDIQDASNTTSRERVIADVRADIASDEASEFIHGFLPEVIFHMAAKASVPASIAHPLVDAETTLLGTVRVLDAARRSGTRKIVFSSTAAIYGDPAVEMPIHERTLPQPISPYGVSKAAAEMYLQTFYHLYGLKYAILRYANVYGPRQGVSGEGGVIAIFAQQFAKQQPIRLFGDGLHTRDYIFVGDIVRANLLAADHHSNILCNVSTGIETTTGSLIHAFEQITLREVPIMREVERSGDIRKSALSPQLAKELFGFTAYTELCDGLQKTYQWMLQHGLG